MRTNIDIDERKLREVMKLYDLETKKDAVNQALDLMVRLKLQARIRKLRGKIKWEGDLRKMRGKK